MWDAKFAEDRITSKYIKCSNGTRLVEIQKVPKKIAPKNSAYLMKQHTIVGCKNIDLKNFQSWPFGEMAFKVYS